MRWTALLATCMLFVGCVPAAQPESAKVVAAFEVPLGSEADRDQFLLVLRVAAEAEHMHVDSENKRDLARETKVHPAFEKTLNAAVWRGVDDGEAVASAMDQPDHLGQVWISFTRGTDVPLTARFRESVMHKIMLRWPGTQSLPVTAAGVIPLKCDLIRTSNGYVVNPSAAKKYGLDTPSN